MHKGNLQFTVIKVNAKVKELQLFMFKKKKKEKEKKLDYIFSYTHQLYSIFPVFNQLKKLCWACIWTAVF